MKTFLLGDVCDLMTGGTPSRARKDYFEGGDIKWLVSGDINQVEIFDCEGRITEKNLKSTQKLFERKLDKFYTDLLDSEQITYLEEVVKDEKYAIKRGPFGSALRKSFFVDKGYKVYEQKNAIQDNCKLGHYYI